MRRIPIALLGLLLVAACKEPPPRAKISETIPNVPIPPNAEILSSSGSEDALQLRFRSTLQPDQVASYYRMILAQKPWRLVSDDLTEDGAVALYAEQDGPPLWVTIKKAAGAHGTLVDLAGAKTVKKP